VLPDLRVRVRVRVRIRVEVRDLGSGVRACLDSCSIVHHQ